MSGASFSLASILGKLTPEEAEYVLSLTAPQLTTQVRLHQRDDAIRALIADLPELRPIKCAERVALELRRYAAAGWTRDREKPEPDTADPRRQLLHQVLRFNKGEPLGWRQIHNVAGGHRGRENCNSGQFNLQESADSQKAGKGDDPC